MKVCSTPGCPELTPSGKCEAHRRAAQRDADAKRPSSAARGYNRQHRRNRLWWMAAVKTETVICPRCHQPILKGEPWDLGHDDHDRSLPTHPEHARCNRATKTHAAAD